MPSFTLDLALDNPRVPERGDLVATARTVYRLLLRDAVPHAVPYPPQGVTNGTEEADRG